MSRFEWTTALLRILAIWLGVGILLSLPGVVVGMLGLWGEASDQIYEIYELVVFILQAVLAVAIWALARPLASVVWRGDGSVETASPISPRDLHIAMISALGLYVVVTAIPDLASTIGYIHFRTTELRPDYSYPQDFRPRSIGLLLQLAAGIWLLFDADKLVDKISGRRNSAISETAV